MNLKQVLLFVALFGASIAQQNCGGYVDDTPPYGTLYSTKDSDSQYLANSDCVWNFTSQYSHYGVKFTFTNIYTELYQDIINIYEDGQVIYSLTGNVSGTYSTSSPNTKVEFYSNNFNQYQAFSFEYQWIQSCGFTVNNLYGTIVGPSGSDGAYPANANCTWRFPAFEPYVALNFSHLQLETSDDYIYIYSGARPTQYLVKTLSGDIGSSSIEVATPAAVVFVSDSSTEYLTFSLTYEFQYAPSDSDSDSNSGSGSSSSSSSSNGVFIAFLFIVIFLFGCVGGGVIGICFFKMRQQRGGIPMSNAGYVPIPYPYQMAPPATQVPLYPQVVPAQSQVN